MFFIADIFAVTRPPLQDPVCDLSLYKYFDHFSFSHGTSELSVAVNHGELAILNGRGVVVNNF